MAHLDAASPSPSPSSRVVWPRGVEKYGAGLALVTATADVLVLLRSASSRNPGTWGLPGGNVDAADATLLACACREAREEMGSVPDFQVVRQVLTKRGKRAHKWFKVFVCKVASKVKEDFKPVLNEEHEDFAWTHVDALAKMPLHPVVRHLFSGSFTLDTLKKIVATGNQTAPVPVPGPVPVPESESEAKQCNDS